MVLAKNTIDWGTCRQQKLIIIQESKRFKMKVLEALGYSEGPIPLQRHFLVASSDGRRYEGSVRSLVDDTSLP